MEVLRDLVQRINLTPKIAKLRFSNYKVSKLIDVVTSTLELYEGETSDSKIYIMFSAVYARDLECVRYLHTPDRGWITLGVRRWKY
jgi:hypothetical protein